MQTNELTFYSSLFYLYYIYNYIDIVYTIIFQLTTCYSFSLSFPENTKERVSSSRTGGKKAETTNAKEGSDVTDQDCEMRCNIKS